MSRVEEGTGEIDYSISSFYLVSGIFLRKRYKHRDGSTSIAKCLVALTWGKEKLGN